MSRGAGEGRRVEVGQVVYGSRSGERNFRILADSGDLSRDEHDAVRHYSNLGGSAQTESDPPDLFAAYPLGTGGRTAFSRTTFLGAGGRGNDYLAHVLLLDAAAVELLRGDLFLLSPRLLADKPARPELPRLAFDAADLERESQRPCGADAQFPFAELAGVLRALADGPLALPARDPEAGPLLCRSVLSALPPDDRRRLSFCSRFSHPRRVAFRLTAFLPQDRSLVEAGLDGYDPERLRLTRGGAEGDPFVSWARRLDAGVEPLTGLSLLDRPGEAARLAEALDRWLAWIAGGDRSTSSPAETAEAEGLPLVALANHPRNRVLPRTGRLLLDAALRRLIQRAAEALGSEAPGDALRAAGEEAAASAPPEAVFDALVERVRRGSRPTTPPITAAALAFVLAHRGAAAAEAILSLDGRPALWSAAAAAAGDLAALAAAAPRALLALCASWFGTWRRAAGTYSLVTIGTLLARFATTDENLLRLALQAVEQAAPPTRQAEDRRFWFLGVVRGLRAEMGSAYPTWTAARLVAEEGLLADLEPAEATELASPLAAAFGDRVADQVEPHRVPWPVLRSLLFACTGGLLAAEHRGDGWSVTDKPARWRLAARVAEASAQVAAEQDDRRALAEVVWLVWAASRHLAPGDSLQVLAGADGGDAVSRFVAALDRAVLAGAPEPDVALRAAWWLQRLGLYSSDLAPRETGAWLTRARGAARGVREPALFHWATRARAAHLSASLAA